MELDYSQIKNIKNGITSLIQEDKQKAFILDPRIRLSLARNLRMCDERVQDIEKAKKDLFEKYNPPTIEENGQVMVDTSHENSQKFLNDFTQLCITPVHTDMQTIDAKKLMSENNQISIDIIYNLEPILENL